MAQQRTRTIKKHFVILKDEGCVPEKKGPWRSFRRTIQFVREAIAARPATTEIIVARLTWNDDLWVDSGRELVRIEDAFAEYDEPAPAAVSA